MSDVHMPSNHYQHRRTRGTKVRVDNLPIAEDLAQQPHKGDDADRFSLYTPQQIEAETKDVKLCITFGECPGDVMKIREQADMIIAGMRAIIEKTRQHDIGSVRQRIEARAEAASLGRALSRFNGRTPHGEWKPKGHRS